VVVVGCGLGGGRGRGDRRGEKVGGGMKRVVVGHMASVEPEWGGGIGRGIPLPSRLGGLGSVVSSPSAKNHFTAFKAYQNASRCNVC